MTSVIVINVKRYLNMKGLKQKIVAEKAGFGEREFSNMLNGRKVIKAEDIIPIANALGVEPNDICKTPDQPKAS